MAIGVSQITLYPARGLENDTYLSNCLRHCMKHSDKIIHSLHIIGTELVNLQALSWKRTSPHHLTKLTKLSWGINANDRQTQANPMNMKVSASDSTMRTNCLASVLQEGTSMLQQANAVHFPDSKSMEMISSVALPMTAWIIFGWSGT